MSEIVKRESEAIQPSEALNAVLNLARDPNVNMDTVERLIALHERMTAREAEKAFIEAKRRVKERLPVIKKTGEIYDKNRVLRSKYVQYEKLQEIIEPIMAEEGFAPIKFDATSQDGKLYTIFARLSHSAGHSETTELGGVPLDHNGFRSNIQDVGSTMSYCQRRLTMMIFNIRQEGEDDDGNGGDKVIGPEQLKDLTSLIEEVKGNPRLLCEIFNVDTLDKILARDYEKAVRMMEMKRRR